MYTKSPKKITANVVCPEGKEYPVSCINIVDGLGAWTILFIAIIIIAVIKEVREKRIARDFCFFR